MEDMQENYEAKLMVMQKRYESKLDVVNAELVQVKSALQELRETSKDLVAMMRNNSIFRGASDQGTDVASSQVPADSSCGSTDDDN
ncbi:hypothetical protein GH714_034347 [Hevea brasiliensis]|uniref:Uncharacterized protein n=1 Tax=Hevea brasiliensis TaxID=3981 RepID=A0A6A6NE30_HEVBR|nr:hypothetical protein GH714_034347 [Hevea brasiliensis]